MHYAIGRAGKAWDTPPTDPDADADLEPIFNAIINEIPAPQVEQDSPSKCWLPPWHTTRWGKYSIGRITRGHIKPGVLLFVRKMARWPKRV